MNKFFKYTFIALLGVLTLGLSSCTDEYEYTPTSKTELGGNAFLVSEGSTAKSFLPTAEQIQGVSCRFYRGSDSRSV